MFFKRLCMLALSLFCICLHSPLFSQVSDEIQIEAVFAQFIDIQVLESEVFWEVATIDDYKNGFWPIQRPIPFQVSASTDFRIEFYNTPFINGSGGEVILENLAYRLEPANATVQGDFNKKYQYATPDGKNNKANLSGIFIASLSPKTILQPGPDGNAGPYEQNYFKIRIGMASANIRQITGLPTLLEQNISPGTYVTNLTLVAVPEP